ncbi:MAG: 2,3-bisphosphoglycerate-independent phosphoglycerate mutase [Minisyncoccia bacterium]
MFLSKKICLVILDGWGIGKKDFTNAIYQAKTSNIDEIKKYYPMTTLQASGNAVGLPYNVAGNSEVGHLTIGTGQILYHYSIRILNSIKNKTFFENPQLKSVFEHVKNNNSTIHFIGLLSSNLVHSSYSHLLALLDFAQIMGIKKVNLHLFTDGRDSPPTSSVEMLENLIKELESKQLGQIATLSGRFYGMDRDKNYERTQKAYNAIVFGKGQNFTNPVQYLKDSYQQNITDEFIIPAVNKNISFPTTIENNDGIIFFNFREERMRQLCEAFAFKNFDKFPLKLIENVDIATFTQYREDFPFKVAFPPQKINISLAKILSENNKRQLHLAETEKYAHVTFFFNGLNEKPHPGEYWIMIPSIKTLHLEDFPQLRAPEITTRLLQAFDENIYDFIVVNYANGDLIGHTGNIEAGIKAATIIDEMLGKIIPSGFKYDYTFLITADHGNLERMANPITGEIETEHDSSLVPFYLVDKRLRLTNPRSDFDIQNIENHSGGMLADISPTILSLFNLPIPKEMLGQSLLPLLNIY